MALVETVLSFVVGIVASLVAAYMLSRYIVTRRAHHLLWSVGLALWAASSFGQGTAFVSGWSVASYKLYYFSAILLAGFLGAGTLGLVLRRRRVFQVFAAYVIGFAAAFGLLLALAPVDEAVLAHLAIGGQALPAGVRMWTPLVNIPGGIAFIGGAAYSIVRTRKAFAVLITLGAALPALGGILARLGVPAVLPFTDFAGIACLSAGIVMTLRPAPAPEGIEDAERRPSPRA